MSPNEVTVTTPADDSKQKFDPGPYWLPWVVSAIHLIFLIVCTVVIAALNGYLSPSVLRVLPIPLPLPSVAVSSFCLGVIGGTLCASRWVILSVGRQIYDKQRVLWQIMTPIHGGFMAIFILIAIRAGMMSMVGNMSDEDVSDPNRYMWFIMALSFLSGFASKVVTERIEGMARALFGKNPESPTLVENDKNSGQGGEGQT